MEQQAEKRKFEDKKHEYLAQKRMEKAARDAKKAAEAQQTEGKEQDETMTDSSASSAEPVVDTEPNQAATETKVEE